MTGSTKRLPVQGDFEYARQAGQELPLSAVHRPLLMQAAAAGNGELDNAAVIRELRRCCVDRAAEQGTEVSMKGGDKA